MQLIDLVRSTIAAIRASAALGRGFRLRDCGELRGALIQAQIGLCLLREPYVRRRNAPEASALASLTILAEEVGVKLGVQGASVADLTEAIAILRGLTGERQPDLCSYIPFLETRLAASPKSM